MLVPPAKILRGNETSLPQAGVGCTRVFLVDREAPLGGRLQIERPSLAHQPVAKIDAGNGALPYPSLWVGRIGANILALDRPPRDELVQFFCDRGTAREQLSILVEAKLISFRRVDPVKPEALTVDLNGVDVDTMCVAWTGQSKSKEHQRGNSAAHHTISPDHCMLELLIEGHALTVASQFSRRTRRTLCRCQARKMARKNGQPRGLGPRHLPKRDT